VSNNLNNTPKPVQKSTTKKTERYRPLSCKKSVQEMILCAGFVFYQKKHCPMAEKYIFEPQKAYRPAKKLKPF
jgi:hypothetical protein